VYSKIVCLYQLWYMLSKTLAEEAAWKFAKENAIDMVAINPGLVIGPLLQPTLNTSVESLLKLVNGTLQLMWLIYVYIQ
jgi:nucleoside-diphosphate-sugar epimerase